MIKDYHMHPTVINDPGRVHSFAERAIAMGIDEICVTDHMPLSVSNAADRIPAGRVEEYCRAVRRMAEEYEGRLSVKLGIEIDYHPDFSEEIGRVLAAGKYDFVLGSSHLHVTCPELLDGRTGFNEYAGYMIRNSILAARSGLVDSVAHLDFYRWMFTLPERFPLTDDGYEVKKHEKLIDELLYVLREEGVRLEINSHLAAKTGSLIHTYPEMEIAERAVESGVKFSFGSDAHRPEHVGAHLDALRLHLVYGRAIREWEENA